MTQSPHRSWSDKFRDTFRGLRTALFGQSSFRVHLLAAVLVILLATCLHVSRMDWLVLLLCITMVLVAEMFNTAIERMAKAITREENPHLGAALDIAAAAVLLASFGSIVVGSIVFWPYLAAFIE